MSAPADDLDTRNRRDLADLVRSAERHIAKLGAQLSTEMGMRDKAEKKLATAATWTRDLQARLEREKKAHAKAERERDGFRDRAIKAEKALRGGGGR